MIEDRRRFSGRIERFIYLYIYLSIGKLTGRGAAGDRRCSEESAGKRTHSPTVFTRSIPPFQIEEKEPSEIEDYDPYKGSYYPASHYGSHTTLHKQPYNGGMSTLGGRSHISNASDHYTTVHSRPHSRLVPSAR